MKKKRFPIAIAAGSWDHFHEGHKAFLMKAFAVADEVWVGVTAPELTKHKPWAATIEPFATRRRNVRRFIQEQGTLSRAKFFRLEDIYGPAIESTTQGALLVTDDTRKGGTAVNDRRRDLGLAPLQLIEVPFFMARDDKPLSSERIRRGEVNRLGHLYRNLFVGEKTLHLPEKLRASLSRPFGRLVADTRVGTALGKSAPLRVAVGDVVTTLFLRNRIRTDLFIVDLRVERQQKYSSLSELGFSDMRSVTHLKNPAGTVTAALNRAIERAVGTPLSSEPQIIQVEGEEDLAVLPVVLALPLGSQVFYGQLGRGVVVVDVTEEKKQEAYELLAQFEPLV